MISLIREHTGRLLLVVLLHAVLFAALLLNVSFLAPHAASLAARAQMEPVEVIEAVAVDVETFERREREILTAEQERIAEALQREEEARREVERQRQEEIRRQQEEQARREAEEQARVQALREAEEARQEAIRVAEEARRLAEAERARIEQQLREAEAERARAEEARRAAEAARQAAEAERRAQEEAERRRAEEEARRREAQARELEEQRRREQMEQEQRRLAAARAEREAADRRAREDAQRQAYIAEVQATVERRWRKPEGTPASDEAVVLVRINPDTGRILSFDVQRCSGSAAFCESVRQTMDRLQSLPRPPDAAAVRGGIRIRFSPETG